MVWQWKWHSERRVVCVCMVMVYVWIWLHVTCLPRAASARRAFSTMCDSSSTQVSHTFMCWTVLINIFLIFELLPPVNNEPKNHRRLNTPLRSEQYLFRVGYQSGQYLTRVVRLVSPAIPRHTILGRVHWVQRVCRRFLIVFDGWANLVIVGGEQKVKKKSQKLTLRRHFTHTLALHISHW